MTGSPVYPAHPPLGEGAGMGGEDEAGSVDILSLG